MYPYASLPRAKISCCRQRSCDALGLGTPVAPRVPRACAPRMIATHCGLFG